MTAQTKTPRQPSAMRIGGAFLETGAGRRRRGPERKSQLSTDGFAGYPSAVDLAFAQEATYGQIIKSFNEGEQPGRYGPPDMVQADRRPYWGIEDAFSICTSHVERNNLTIRTFMRRYTRLSLGFSKKLENLEAAVALHVTYFKFCWRPAWLVGHSGDGGGADA
jgi:hypothetical protein